MGLSDRNSMWKVPTRPPFGETQPSRLLLRSRLTDSQGAEGATRGCCCALKVWLLRQNPAAKPAPRTFLFSWPCVLGRRFHLPASAGFFFFLQRRCFFRCDGIAFIPRKK